MFSQSLEDKIYNETDGTYADILLALFSLTNEDSGNLSDARMAANVRLVINSLHFLMCSMTSLLYF